MREVNNLPMLHEDQQQGRMLVIDEAKSAKGMDMKIVHELVKVAKTLLAGDTNHYVMVRLDGGASAVKRIKIPDNVWDNHVDRNEFTREYFKNLGYNKVEIIRWT